MKLLLASVLFTVSLIADDVVFRGVPAVRVLASTDNDVREPLDAAAAQKNECVIVQRGKKYFWASRENAPVTRIDSPQFTYFVHSGGAGYVKVFTGERKAVKAPADYIEHLSRGFETITYWGRVAEAH